MRRKPERKSRIVKVTVKGKQYRVRMTRDEDRWIVAVCLDLKGAITQGKTLRAATKNIKDAIRLMQEVLEEDKKKELACAVRAHC